MLEETSPDSSDAVLRSQNSIPSEPPVVAQYYTRRELRAAQERDAKRHGSSHSSALAKRAEAPIVVAASAAAIPVTKSPAAAHDPLTPRMVKPTRAERSAARRLTAPERTPVVRATFAPRKKQKPAVVLMALLLVPGFVASASLPAFAFAPVGSEHQAELELAADAADAAALPSQELSVDSTATGAAVQRDAITATSETELKAQQIAAAALASYQTSTSTSTSTVSGTVTTASAAGDDYPWSSADNTLSPLNYYYRQCVDFVAWRLNRDAGVTSAPWKYVWSNLTPTGGNASAWKAAWVANGWTTSSTPVVGSVAWFTGNHVAYVKEIVGSNVVIEEYNGMAKLAYAIRTIPISSVASFLYPPPR